MNKDLQVGPNASGVTGGERITRLSQRTTSSASTPRENPKANPSLPKSHRLFYLPTGGSSQLRRKPDPLRPRSKKTGKLVFFVHFTTPPKLFDRANYRYRRSCANEQRYLELAHLHLKGTSTSRENNTVARTPQCPPRPTPSTPQVARKHIRCTQTSTSRCAELFRKQCPPAVLGVPQQYHRRSKYRITRERSAVRMF